MTETRAHAGASPDVADDSHESRRSAARAVADSVLYEGYVLYPYRASARKNQSRWQFGVVMPTAYAATDQSESSVCQTECVLEAAGAAEVEVLIRYLQVQRRSVRDAAGTEVGTLDVDGTPVSAWEEAVEREVAHRWSVAELLDRERSERMHAEASEQTEPLRDAAGDVVGSLVRRTTALHGTLTVSATEVPGPWGAVRIRVRVANATPLDDVPLRREDALPAAFVAVHAIVSATGGAFMSMLEPSEWARPAVDECRQIGLFPVLAGVDGSTDVMLASPIILYDQPGLAPESPGDLYDATEIDEILTLRTLALTEAEKREARATDPRAAAIIDRVDAMDATTMDRLHGAIRYLRDVTGDGPHPSSEPEPPPTAEAAPWWDPEADASVSPSTDGVVVSGIRLQRGSAVRLTPGARRADAQDMFLSGRRATIEAVLFDVDDAPYFAVTLDADPSAELQRAHGRFLYFSPDEVEPA